MAWSISGTISSDGEQPSYPDGPADTGNHVEDLTPSGSITASTPGQVIENLYITGQLLIRAAGVVVRNCTIESDAYYPVDVDSSGASVDMSDCTIFGTQSICAAAILCGAGEGTFTRVDVSACQDGVKLGNNSTLQHSWVHDTLVSEEAHADGVQSSGPTNQQILYNRIEVPMPNGNSAILLGGGETRPAAHNVLVQGNYLDGGNYIFYGPADVDGNVTDPPSSHVYVLDNVFGRNFQYGPCSQWEDGDEEDPNVWSGNVYADDGSPVSPG